MTMTSIVALDDQIVSHGAKLAAFIGGEIHGVTGSMDGPPFGPFAHIPQFALMTYGNAGDAGQAVTYELCVGGKSYTTVVISDPGADSYRADKALGSAVAPVTLRFSSAPPPPVTDADPSCASYVEAGFTCPFMGPYACHGCAATCGCTATKAWTTAKAWAKRPTRAASP